MISQLTLEESIRTFESFLAERAQKEGYEAYVDGVDRSKIPERLGVFSGYWVEGWLAAARDAATRDSVKEQPFADTYQGFKISRLTSVAPTLLDNLHLN
jgi:ribosome modulation factor